MITAMESLYLSATKFNPGDKMKITQRKILDKQPCGLRKQSVQGVLCRKVSSAFGVVGREEDESNYQKESDGMTSQDSD